MHHPDSSGLRDPGTGASNAASPTLARFLRIASIGVMFASLGVAAARPATAAEPVQTGPTVVVTGARDPADTPSAKAYVDETVRRLQRASRYPSGREASLERPSGTSTVWVELLRNGRVAAHGLEQSSGSPMLDAMAGQLVARGKYGALPTDGWADQALHRFVVSYRFDGPAMTAGRNAAIAKQ